MRAGQRGVSEEREMLDRVERCTLWQRNARAGNRCPFFLLLLLLYDVVTSCCAACSLTRCLSCPTCLMLPLSPLPVPADSAAEWRWYHVDRCFDRERGRVPAKSNSISTQHWLVSQRERPELVDRLEDADREDLTAHRTPVGGVKTETIALSTARRCGAGHLCVDSPFCC